MGLLDDIVGKAQQQLGQASSGANPIELLSGLSQLLGGSGGLAGLVRAFEKGGLGHLIQSWIGTGPNLPVSAAQLQQVFGAAPLQQLAAKAGMAPEALTGQLSQYLPMLVDKLTPDGKLPQGDPFGDAMGMLKKFL